MDRRSFIRLGSLAGLSLTSFSLSRCSPVNNPSKDSSSHLLEGFELAELSIADLQRKMEKGEYTSEQLVNLYLQRIKQIDSEGPALNSIIELNPEAIGIAEKLDEERRKGIIRGPMHGIPVLIKDNIDTSDKMHTTAGSLALEGNYALSDAHIVKQMRNAGAIIIGKTNLSEWANFRSTHSISGWSSRGGQTHNPYVLDRTPCGSSSGSAVAVSANLCAVAIGTETDGSIACPASMNGIVGVKPTIGLVSRSGIIPISHSQDTAGPLTRTVTDAAILLGVIAGADANDSVTNRIPFNTRMDYLKFLNVDGLKGKRIGIEKSFLKVHNGVDALLQKSIELMESLGAEVVEVEFMTKQSEVGNAEFELLKFEFKDGLNKYLSSSNSVMKSLEDVIEFNLKNEARVMPFFKQEILIDSQAKGSLDSEEYKGLLDKVMELRRYVDNLFEMNHLDALCGPATGPSWCIDYLNGDSWTGYGTYSPAAVLGYPSVTLPMGILFGQMPIGISFLGKAFSEPTLFSIAYAFEQASGQRVVPQFNQTLKV
jgi:amidase